jgi:hypothetical protein
MTELPEHVQAVVDAALAWHHDPNGYGSEALFGAVDAYRKAETPQPFECEFARLPGSSWRHGSKVASDHPGVERWRCQVTPIERVR